MSVRARHLPGVAAWGLAAAAVLTPDAAHAFGGVFVPEGSSPNVTHRVALAVQRDGVVMWDQITLKGSSKNVAWVLPMRPGSTAELTSDAYLTALDASTRAVVYSPPDFGPVASCALSGCSQDPAYGQGPDRLTVTRNATTEPVESAVVSGADPARLPQWLRDRGLAIPKDVEPAIAAYAREGWDFQVYRFEPDCNAQSSRVARIVTRGVTEAILPTRLLAAGTGYATSVTLFTLAPTRLAPAGVANETVDGNDLLWSEKSNTSNYEDLANQVIRRGALLTELAEIPTRSSASSGLPTVYDLYPGLCGQAALPGRADVKSPDPPRACTSPSPSDAGADGASSDAGDASADADSPDADADAGADADADADAGDWPADAGQEDADGAGDAGASATPRTPDRCASPDDLVVALRGGLDTLSTVVTRMRGQPATWMLGGQDLRFLPASGLVSNQLQAIEYDDREAVSRRDKKTDHPNRSAACGTVRRRPYASWTAVLGAVAALAAAWARRRARP